MLVSAVILACMVMPTGLEQRVLILDLQADDAVKADAHELSAELAAHLAQSTVHAVATSADVRTMLQVAGEKQLLGCLDESCFPRIAAVLEARHVIHGGLRRTGEGWQMQLVHLDVDNGVTLKRTEERAPSVTALRARVPALADDLALALREPTGGVDVVAGATLLKNRNDCVWAASRLFRAKERRLRPIDRVYVAHFESTHFDVGEFDRMRRALPLARRAFFPGRFPACHGRTMATQDAFLIEDAQTVAALVDRQAATALSGRRKDRKLTLELVFTLVDASFSPLPPPDLALCGPTERARVPELSPTVTIRVVGGAVVDAERGTRTPIGILGGDGVAFSRLDDPGNRP